MKELCTFLVLQPNERIQWKQFPRMIDLMQTILNPERERIQQQAVPRQEMISQISPEQRPAPKHWNGSDELETRTL
jgi:hypothetical protein